MKWIDSYSHFRSFSAKDSNILKNPVANWAFDGFTRLLNTSKITKAYSKYQDIVNLHDNRFIEENPSLVKKSFMAAAMLTNLPFYAGKDENDLLSSMGRNLFDHSIVINLEPFSKAASLLHACNGKKYLTPVVNLDADSLGSFEQRFDAAVAYGARGIAIHPIIEKKQAWDPHYFKCASLARSYDVPMVCRTGITSYFGDYDANAAEISNYENLVAANPKTTFIMSHSNLAGYLKAIEFAQNHENVFLDSAWQTRVSVQKIINSIGADRLLLASDWPIMGDQQKVQRRIFSKLNISDTELEKIVFTNAKNLYKIEI